jgi:hypothetical protein
MTTMNRDDAMFRMIGKSLRGEPQKCNICETVAVMKNTNVCDSCLTRPTNK